MQPWTEKNPPTLHEKDKDMNIQCMGVGNLNETKACHGHQFHPVSDNTFREAQNCLPKRNEIKGLTRTWQMSKNCIFLQICSEEMYSKGI